MFHDSHSPEEFDVNALVSGTPDETSTALSDICHRGDNAIAGLVAALNNRAYLFEYVVTGVLYTFVDPRSTSDHSIL